MSPDLNALCAWGHHKIWQIHLPRWDAAVFDGIWLRWHEASVNERPLRLHVLAWIGHASEFCDSFANASCASASLPNHSPAEKTRDRDTSSWSTQLNAQIWGVIPGTHRFRLANNAIHLTVHVGVEQLSREEITQDKYDPALASPCQPLIATDQTITVIGSGIAGAATARALADVGYQVRILDTGDTPAAGASGLPAGLVAPHASPDDAPVSRLSRSGIRAMHQAMQRLLTLGQDWGATGVTEHRLPGKTRKGGVPSAWNTPEYTASHDWTRPLSDVSTSLRHSKAAWVKPAELVKQLLAHPHIQWQGQTTVDRLSHDGHQWTLHTSTQELIKTDQLILAAGPHSSRLLKTFTDSAPPIQPLRGQLSWGLMSQIDQAPIPETPTNGNGSFIANVPTDSGLAWYVGSTFDRHRDQPVEDEQDHIENWQRLSALLPETAAAIQPLFTEKQVKAWVRVRAAVPDRLPLVGQLTHVPTGLWMVTALGSRGLSLGVLCGELLTAQWAGEPLAIESKLIHKLNASRFTN